MSESADNPLGLPDPMQEVPARAVARAVARVEAAAVAALVERFDTSFDRAVELLAGVTGHILVSGAGKSGQIAAKVAATLTSTGSPATFVHPVDALHGDLGLVRAGDAALVFSRSGGTGEVRRLLPPLRAKGVPAVAVTAYRDSELGRAADCVVETGAPPEASPFGLVPTSSTTAALVVGDALAVALMVRRGFRRQDFAELHPGGALGGGLNRQVAEVMHRGDACPKVQASAPLRQALDEIMRKRLGMTTVVDKNDRLVGVLTDGDLKRIFLAMENPLDAQVGEVMSAEPRTIAPVALVSDALEAMEQNQPGPITALVVVDGSGCPAGVIHLHDCLKPAG